MASVNKQLAGRAGLVNTGGRGWVLAQKDVLVLPVLGDDVEAGDGLGAVAGAGAGTMAGTGAGAVSGTGALAGALA